MKYRLKACILFLVDHYSSNHNLLIYIKTDGSYKNEPNRHFLFKIALFLVVILKSLLMHKRGNLIQHRIIRFS